MTETQNYYEAEYIYIIKTREFIRSNEDVFKIGRTSQINLGRYENYPKYSLLLYQSLCLNSKLAENKIKDLFNFKYKKLSIGTEYFEGNFWSMRNDIINIINEVDYQILIENGSFKLNIQASILDKIENCKDNNKKNIIKNEINNINNNNDINNDINNDNNDSINNNNYTINNNDIIKNNNDIINNNNIINNTNFAQNESNIIPLIDIIKIKFELTGNKNELVVCSDFYSEFININKKDITLELTNNNIIKRKSTRGDTKDRWCFYGLKKIA